MHRRIRYAVIAVTLVLVASVTAGPFATIQPVAAEPTPIDACTTITEPGRYVLTENLRDVTDATCIRIAASDVVLDGDGKRIEGTWDGDNVPSASNFRDDRRSLELAAPVSAAVTVDPTPQVPNETPNQSTPNDGAQSPPAMFTATSLNAPTDEILGADGPLTPTRPVERSPASANETDAPGNDTSPDDTPDNDTTPPSETPDNDTVPPGQTPGNDTAPPAESPDNDTAPEQPALTNVTVTDLRVTGWYVGVYVDGADATTVRDVEVRDSGFGILLWNATNASVVTSELTRNDGVGVVVLGATDTSLFGVTSERNELGGLLVDGSEGTSVREGDFSNNVVVGAAVDFSNGTSLTETVVERNDETGISVLSASNTTVRDALVTSNGGTGVDVRTSSQTLVTGSTVRRNDVGIAVFRSPTTRLNRNIVSDNDRINIFIR
ncbi:right-handed parallel beta-helix repeat-containing protein [Halogeometricum limi]|uniref:right-handed parallel beta-helix repeat-containing protein n=1 Tax=Halogeometricum limi TaxID=555875 RepID=UPI00158779FE|nr:right-handed parallel beta-helix repeat-containing protein [Halogeometricum limi]